MEENQKRQDVSRALTTDEIRQQAHKWNLAGDVGLLAHLEQFSQNLLNKSRETQKNINELLDSVEDTSVTINNVTNQFLALQNSQFVENRVYDDDSPVEEEGFESNISKEEQEKLLLVQYKEAVDIGVKILDTHFDEVQLAANSDSDEEVLVENPGLIWKPKNPYAGKRFPLLIGSAEWWADDNVGLGEYEENVKPEELSPESFSDMEADDNSEKRIKMSSSSSTESERICNKKSKDHSSSVYQEDIFPSPGRGPFNIQSNLVNEEEPLSKPPPISFAKAKDNIKPNFTNSVGDVSDWGSSKRNSDSLFDENSEEDCNAKSTPAVTKENKFQNDFAKELSAKLFSVVNKKVVEPNTEHRIPEETVNKIPSALFAENDDNDSFFSVENSASTKLFKKKSLYSDVDGDDRFGDAENLFSGSNHGHNVKKTVTINSPKEVNGIVDKGRGVNSSKYFDKSIKFLNDDLSESNDDFLFTGKSAHGPSQNSGGLSADLREVKFSTPTEQRGNQEVPNADNLFGGVSEIRSNGSSNIESVSAISNDNSFNFARYMSVETSKDYGFIEPSDISSNKSEKSGSPGAFEPKLSSTRRISYDTSDYKTHRVSSYQASNMKHGSDDPQLQENLKPKIGHSENAHYSREQSETNKAKGLFTDDDEDDDLFQASKHPKSLKETRLFDEVENDNLFSSLAPKTDEKAQSIFSEKSENSILFQNPSAAFSVGEEEKPTPIDKMKQPDSVSMSSSRSSLFDDLNVGKSNLASVFERDKSIKNSDDLFSTSDDDLFGEKKTTTFEDFESENLLRDNSVMESMGSDKKSLSLFDDLDETDDLFSDIKHTNIFHNYKNDDDLFGESINSSNNKTADNINKIDVIAVPKQNNVYSVNRQETDFDVSSYFNEESDSSLRDVINAADKNLQIDNGKEDIIQDIQCKSKVTNLFDGLEDEDEDEDLFNNTESKQASLGYKIEKTGIRAAPKDQNPGVKSSFEDDSKRDDDFLKTLSPKKEKIEESSKKAIGLETECEIATNANKLSESDIIQKLSNRETKNDVETITDTIIKPNNRKELNNNMKIEDLFPNENSNLKVLENTNLFNADEFDDNNLFKNGSLEENIIKEDGARPSPPTTLNIIKKLDLPHNQENSYDGTDKHVISAVKPKSVGKLNIPSNLKINPMNLVPGTVLRKNILSQKTDEPEDVTETEKDFYIRSTEVPSNLLKCLSKDRVKIQTRRRPQTRRARHEALRSSGIDFPVDPALMDATLAVRSKSVDNLEEGLTSWSTLQGTCVPNHDNSVLVRNDREPKGDSKMITNAESSEFHSVENSPEALFSSPLLSNPLSPSTDEEDYFNVPELDVNFEREDQSIFKSSENNFSNDDDNLLFDGAPILSPLSPTKSMVTQPEEDWKQIEQIKSVSNCSDIQAEIRSKIVKNRMPFEGEDYDDSDGDDTILFSGSKSKTPGSCVTEKSLEPANDIFDDLEDNDSILFQSKSISVLGAREILKNSLFEDTNDDIDDLFSDKSIQGSTASKVIKDTPVNKVIKSSISEKSKEPFIDPLGLMEYSE